MSYRRELLTDEKVKLDKDLKNLNRFVLKLNNAKSDSVNILKSVEDIITKMNGKVLNAKLLLSHFSSTYTNCLLQITHNVDGDALIAEIKKITINRAYIASGPGGGKDKIFIDIIDKSN